MGLACMATFPEAYVYCALNDSVCKYMVHGPSGFNEGPAFKHTGDGYDGFRCGQRGTDIYIDGERSQGEDGGEAEVKSETERVWEMVCVCLRKGTD